MYTKHTLQLITFNLHTKFEMSSFSCFKDMNGPQSLEIGHTILATTTHGGQSAQG